MKNNHVVLSHLCAGLQLLLPLYPTPTDCHLPTATGRMCNDKSVYASACVLRNKMTCAEKLDYNSKIKEEEVRTINLTPFFLI